MEKRNLFLLILAVLFFLLIVFNQQIFEISGDREKRIYAAINEKQIIESYLEIIEDSINDIDELRGRLATAGETKKITEQNSFLKRHLFPDKGELEAALELLDIRDKYPYDSNKFREEIGKLVKDVDNQIATSRSRESSLRRTRLTPKDILNIEKEHRLRALLDAKNAFLKSKAEEALKKVPEVIEIFPDKKDIMRGYRLSRQLVHPGGFLRFLPEESLAPQEKGFEKIPKPEKPVKPTISKEICKGKIVKTLKIAGKTVFVVAVVAEAGDIIYTFVTYEGTPEQKIFVTLGDCSFYIPFTPEIDLSRKLLELTDQEKALQAKLTEINEEMNYIKKCLKEFEEDPENTAKLCLFEKIGLLGTYLFKDSFGSLRKPPEEVSGVPGITAIENNEEGRKKLKELLEIQRDKLNIIMKYHLRKSAETSP